MTKRETRGLAAVGIGVAAVIATGLSIHAANGGLGTASPPFVMFWSPRLIGWGSLPAVAVLAALVAVAPRLLARPRAPARFAATLFGATLAVALAVNAMRFGPAEWSRVFDLGPGGSFEAANEVLAARPALGYGAHFLIDRFAELVPSQPVGFAGHPPGLPLLMLALGIDTAAGLAALCIGSLAAIAPAVYALARSLELHESVARRAALLACASPGLVLFGATSTDAVFALAGTLTAALLCARRPALRAAGCVALAGAALLSWALLAIGAWAFLVTWARRGRRPALALALACAAAVVALQAVLAGLYGYDPIGALRATGQVYRDSLARTRPYEFWVLGSPVAFAVTAGLPLAAAWLLAALRRAPLAVALVAIVVISAVLGFTKAEVERIWLPFTPLLCLAAATVIDDRRLRPVLGLLAAQTLATEALFGTIW